MDKKWTLGTALAAFVLTVAACVSSPEGQTPAGNGAVRGAQRGSGAFVRGQILVKFKPDTPASVEAEVHETLGGTVKRVLPGIDVRVVAVPEGAELDKVAAYSKHPHVLYAEPDYLRGPVSVGPTTSASIESP